MAKLGVNISGGPDSHSIKVTNAETGDELKGITGGTINISLDGGLTATFTVLVNELNVKLDEIIMKEEKLKRGGCKGCKTESLTSDGKGGLWINNREEECNKYKPPGDNWT